MKPHLHVRALLVVVLALAGTIAGSVSASGSGTQFTVSSSIGSTAMKGGMTLSGSVKWIATPSTTTAITKVDFLIDGTLKWTERFSPYQYNGDGNQLDTTALSDGSHTLKVQAYRSDGKVASTSATVSVSNKKPPPPPPPPPTFTTTSSVQNGATLSGSLTWTASPTGATVSQVDFLIDGTVKWTEKLSPYYFNGDGKQLDTTTLSNGGHTLSVNAYSTGGQKASASSSVTISNSTAPSPSPPPPPALTITTNVANGATLSGSVTWTASPSGGTISKVDFLVDGSVKSTDSTSPYQYNGDGGKLDTTALANGTHTLAAKATATDSRTATASSSVTVSNTTSTPPPAPASGPIPRFGISTGYKILTRTPAQQTYELDQIKAVGAKIVRLDSLPGNQAQLDPVVSGVLARGMEPLLVLFGTTPPISPSTAASFAGAQAAKWKGKVRMYEFANEPDLNGWNGTNYAQALIPAYNAIKAADPNAIVIAGALWKGAGGPVQWVTDMYNAGAKGHFDILSLHLYDDPFAAGSWNIWNMAFHMTPSVRSVMDAHGDTAIPIASTETGGPTTSYGEDGQATIINHDFDALNDPRLAFILVYSMLDDVVTSQPGFGLLRPDFSQRPAWGVFHNRAAAMSS